jgi:hypothetical protein
MDWKGKRKTNSNCKRNEEKEEALDILQQSHLHYQQIRNNPLNVSSFYYYASSKESSFAPKIVMP